MNALEIAKQLLKNLQDNPQAGEQLEKSLHPQSTSVKGFQKSMLDEDFSQTFAKAKKERTVENQTKPDKCPYCGKPMNL